MLFMEITAVFSEERMEYINMYCRQKPELAIRASSTFSYTDFKELIHVRRPISVSSSSDIIIFLNENSTFLITYCHEIT
jgi:hypothetical protein